MVLAGKGLKEALAGMPAESVIQISGTVHPRPQGSTNPKMITGDIEVHVDSVEVLNKATNLAFTLSDKSTAADISIKESLRLEHRYLDLRRHSALKNLELRSNLTMAMRRHLIEKHSKSC